MDLTFHVDPETGLPHIYDHGVTEEEVCQIMIRPGRVEHGRDDSNEGGENDEAKNPTKIAAWLD